MTAAMRKHHGRKRAPILTVHAQSAAGCQSMPISWDASAGKAPWTVMIAPVNQVPYTLSVAQASGSNFALSWNVPKLGKDTQAMVAVADASGTYSGVSSLVTITAGSGSCTAVNDGLDFIWYPTSNSDTPAQCSNWGLTWAQEKATGGVSGDVTFTFLPENGQPITTSAGTGNSGRFTFAVPFDSGTKFLAIGNDGGKAGTGGVGDLYTVATSRKGASKTCKASSVSGNGLPSPSGTLSASVSSSASSTSKSTHAKTTAPTNTSSSSGKTQDNASTSSDGKSSSAGTAVGATFGVLAALALIGVLIWWWRRRQARLAQEDKAWGGTYRNNNVGQDGGAAGSADNSNQVSPWRWSASPYGPPQTTNRASKWIRRASGTAGGGFRILGRGKNEDHGMTEKPTMQPSSFRNISAPQPNYSSNALPLSSSGQPDYPRSPSPAQSQRNLFNSGQSVHSTVPDNALFPPPNPRSLSSIDDSPYGAARLPSSNAIHAQHMQPPSAWQGGSHGGEMRGQSPFNDPPPMGVNSAMPTIGAGVGARGMMMIPSSYDGPTSEVRQGTSPGDSPTSSMSASRTLLSSHGDARNGLGSQAMVPAMSGSSDPFSNQHSVQSNHRVPAPIVSEVMMPESRFTRKPIAEEDEDEGLPYL